MIYMKKSKLKPMSDKQKKLMNFRALMKPIVFDMQGKKCKRCGTKKPDWRGWQLVHIKNLGMGGNPDGSRDTLENYEVDCAPCHFTNPELHNLREV